MDMFINERQFREELFGEKLSGHFINAPITDGLLPRLVCVKNLKVYAKA